MRINPRLLINKMGRLLRNEFVPRPLQEIEKELVFDINVLEKLVEANNAISSLESIHKNMDSLQQGYFSEFCMIKETISSLRIANIDINIDELFLKVSSCETKEYPVRYYNMIKDAMARVDYQNMNTVYLKRLHAEIISDERLYPGQFRFGYHMIQNYYRYVQYYPPFNEDIIHSMNDLDAYMNTSFKASYLIKAALIHYQFIMIFPFFDGNYRMVRLCNLLYLRRHNSFGLYAFYMSYFLFADLNSYYQGLGDVYNNGNYHGWVEYYLHTFIITVEHMACILEDSLALLEENQLKIVGTDYSDSIKTTLSSILDYMMFHPVLIIKDICRIINCSFPTVSKAVKILISLGIIKPQSYYKHSRIYAYDRQLAILCR